MTAGEACLKLVEELPTSFVEALIGQLRDSLVAAMPHPGYQGRVDEFLRRCNGRRTELAPMLEVALAAKRASPAIELVWTGPSTALIPARHTEQVLCEMLRDAERRLTITSFGVFQVPRLVVELEQALARDVALRIILGERESYGDQEIARQRAHLGQVVANNAALYEWAPERRPRDEKGRPGLMHAKAAVADSRIAFLTSANLTEAALERNMELGVCRRKMIMSYLRKVEMSY
jgi:phosphatidylserine/phosphatidylglycerophosphate/cardiolipin synthase-like enzyme